MSAPAPAHPATAAATAWHLAGALVSLKHGVDAHWPKRDKTSDGGIGDARHQALGSGSDHNPWLNNTVRAYDFDVDGIDAGWLAESLRLAGAAGDHRLCGGPTTDDNGYVIWNRHITSPDFTRWVAYDGADPHTSHVHVSVTRDPAGYEDGAVWGFLENPPSLPGPVAVAAPAAAPAPAPAAGTVGPHPGNTAAQAPYPDADPIIVEPGFPAPGQDAAGSGAGYRAQYGNVGHKVEDLQRGLNNYAPLYANLEVDGIFGAETAAVVQDFAHRIANGDPFCPAEDVDGLRGSDGNTVGPRLARAFDRVGIHL